MNVPLEALGGCKAPSRQRWSPDSLTTRPIPKR